MVVGHLNAKRLPHTASPTKKVDLEADKLAPVLVAAHPSLRIPFYTSHSLHAAKERQALTGIEQGHRETRKNLVQREMAAICAM